MSVLTEFFSVTLREWNNMVTWRDGAPVDEFWEMFDRAWQEAAALEANAPKPEKSEFPIYVGWDGAEHGEF